MLEFDTKISIYIQKYPESVSIWFYVGTIRWMNAFIWPRGDKGNLTRRDRAVDLGATFPNKSLWISRYLSVPEFYYLLKGLGVPDNDMTEIKTALDQLGWHIKESKSISGTRWVLT